MSLVNLTNAFASLNSNRYFAGILMLLMNLGSKYLAMELTSVHESFFKSIFVRRFLVFTIFFMGTKDIFVSFILTAVFIVLVSGLFNEKSKYCIIPKKKDLVNKVSKEEYIQAQKILQLYELQNMNNNNF